MVTTKTSKGSDTFLTHYHRLGIYLYVKHLWKTKTSLISPQNAVLSLNLSISMELTKGLDEFPLNKLLKKYKLNSIKSTVLSF